MRQIDVRHRGLEKVIACFEVDGVLVDPGPQSCEDTLLEGLGGERPKALLLTHIHFDHAGAAGALVRRWPDLEVYVHERGAPHMADPERLVASAARLYGGEEGLRETWGEVVPVPEENLKVLSGGETVLGFDVEYTPGHASHHVCYFRDGVAFVGDMAGVRVPPYDLTLAPTPPPDIDVEAWERSSTRSPPASRRPWRSPTSAPPRLPSSTPCARRCAGRPTWRPPATRRRSWPRFTSGSCSRRPTRSTRSSWRRRSTTSSSVLIAGIARGGRPPE